MCGLTGFINRGLGKSDELRAKVTRMTDQLTHRGPDDSGTWVDSASGVALGFRRLSIVDLSEAGHQPMLSHCGRYVIVFNGEVYNANDLRPKLESAGHLFRGHSDTEVMLAAIREWGLKNAVKRFIGMFALALWDRQESTLHLVRDRLGIKPLYYGEGNGTFLFGSELKALVVHPDFEDSIDRDALALQLQYGYIPQPFSIYRNYKKLPPGTILTLKTGSGEGQQIDTYWSAREITERGAETRFRGTGREALDQLEVLLRDSVRLRTIADVNVGAFLSSGIDSSLVVALMQAQNGRAVKTFSLGFVEGGFDEAVQAKKIASHFGTDHTEIYVTPEQALAVIPKLSTMNDEPFSDSSQIPTYLVSALAKQQVTVSLSGDGGDELFGGYNEYLVASRLNRMVGWIPLSLRRGLSALILSVQPEVYSHLLAGLGFLFSRHGRPGPIGHKLHKIADLLPFEQPESLHHSLMAHWSNGQSPLLETRKITTHLTDCRRWARVDSWLQRVTYLDLATYLTDDILAKVDRASMAVGLEARVPLLDHRVVEFAARIPASMKIHRGQGKWLLRGLLARYLPQQLIQKKKFVFSVPIAEWLRGPLREWAADLLSRDRLVRQGLFQPDIVAQLWAEHMSGRRNWHTRLWDILMFQAWSEVRVPRSGELSLTMPYVH